jgi:hypothetical protein
LLGKRISAEKSKEEETGINVAKPSKEGYGLKRAAL